jgi:ABC-2 type transport system permease protein
VSTLPAYASLARLQFRVVYAYRAAAVGGLIITLTRIFLLRVIWTSVYAGSAAADSVTLPGLLTFLTIAQLQVSLMQPTLVTYLQRRIHEGQIGLDLVRPVPFLGQLLAQQVGANLGYLPFVVVAAPFAAVLGNLAPPASPSAAVAYVASFILAWLVSTLIGLLMGLVAFWTVETHGVGTIYNFATQLLGGALVPLAFFPDWLRALADVLPFRAVAAIPVSIWTGAVGGVDLLGALAFQVAWIGLLGLLGWATWERARRVVTVYRG